MEWKCCGYDPEAPRDTRDSCKHYMVEMVPSLLKICKLCGMILGKPDEGESNEEFIDRALLKDKCPTCGQWNP